MRKFSKLILGATLAIGLIFQGSIPCHASNLFSGSYDGFDLSYYEGGRMVASDGWSNGGMFNCVWKNSNVSFHQGIMTLSIQGDQKGGYTGGEVKTKNTYGYGMYNVRMKPIKNNGVVSSFFTYTGPSYGTRWDEIDIEFLGKDTTKVQFNYYTNGVGNHEYLYDLGFDASKEFHQYGFIWAPDHITWFVDNQPVYTAWDNIPSTPGYIMTNVWPGINVNEWLNPFDGKVPLYAQYDWFSYTKLD